MSRTYDDLKGAGGKGFDPEKDKPEPLDLFAYAASRQASESASESVAPAESAVVTPPEEESKDVVSESEEVSSGYEDTPLFKGANYSRQSLAGVIDPLAGVGGRHRKRVPPGLLKILLLGVVVAGIAVFFLLRKDRPAYTSDTVAVEEALRTRPSEVLISVPVPIAPLPQKAKEKLPAFKDLRLHIPGAVVKTEGGMKIITFNKGLFAGGTRLGKDGQRALSSIAKQLSDYGARLSITVIGCTDNTPMNKGSRYANNQALGLQRAQVVVQFLRDKGNFPREIFHSLSYGERWSPYPNKTRADRAKNRTAVLRISCAPAGVIE